MGRNTDKARQGTTRSRKGGGMTLDLNFAFLRAFGISLRLCVNHGPRKYISGKGAERVERRKGELGKAPVNLL
jgi:hypothetical protein